MKVRPFLFAAFTSMAIAIPALAHHSFNMFDETREIVVEGTVTNYAWNNPHVWIDMDVVDENGQPINWGLESRSIGILYRLGWRADSVKPGDHVTVRLNPMKDGTPGGYVITITFPDGRQLDARGRGA